MKLKDPVKSLIEIINSLPVPIVVIKDDEDGQRVLFKNTECAHISDTVLLDSYRTDDPLLDEREKIFNMENGDILWQFSRDMGDSRITFDILYPVFQKNEKPRGSRTLSESIQKIRNANEKLESLIMARMENLSPESRNNLLAKRGLLPV
jgi:hypothetical protein